jgi:hypothetical protein
LQAAKFVDLARLIEAHEDEAPWEDRLKAISRQKPKDEAKRSEVK